MNNKELNEFLSKKLKEGVIHFAYKKKNGENREAFGTINLEHIPVELHPGDKRTTSDSSKRYYDIDTEGWRSFLKENLVFVEGAGYSTEFLNESDETE